MSLPGQAGQFPILELWILWDQCIANLDLGLDLTMAFLLLLIGHKRFSILIYGLIQSSGDLDEVQFEG